MNILLKRFRAANSHVLGFIKGLSSKVAVGLGVALLVVLSGSVLAVREVSVRNQEAEQAESTKLAQLRALEAQQLASESKSGSVAGGASGAPGDQTKTTEGANAKAVPAAPKKYATSSDPRSAAHSTVQPAPSPASFTTKITHNGQVAPGTLISFNATKGEKAFYGGDLILSVPSVTISKSNSALSSKNVIVTVPDGAVANLPSLPWDDRSPHFFIASNGSLSPDTRFDMVVEPLGGQPVGTYQLHISTVRSVQTADAWQYDAFITVNVVD